MCWWWLRIYFLPQPNPWRGYLFYIIISSRLLSCVFFSFTSFFLLFLPSPFAACQDQTVPNIVGLCAGNTSYLPSYSDNCNGSTLSQNSGTSLAGVLPVGHSAAGFVVRDAAGLTAQCTVNVRVIDNEPPTLSKLLVKWVGGRWGDVGSSYSCLSLSFDFLFIFPFQNLLFSFSLLKSTGSEALLPLRTRRLIPHILRRDRNRYCQFLARQRQFSDISHHCIINSSPTTSAEHLQRTGAPQVMVTKL